MTSHNMLLFLCGAVDFKLGSSIAEYQIVLYMVLGGVYTSPGGHSFPKQQFLLTSRDANKHNNNLVVNDLLLYM